MIGRLPMDGIGEGDLGYPALNAQIVRKVGVFRRWLPGMWNIMVPDQANVGAFTSEFQKDVGSTLSFLYAGDSLTGIRLNPQQGLALICDNVTPYSSWLIECIFSHEPPATNFRPIGSSVVRRIQP